MYLLISPFVQYNFRSIWWKIQDSIAYGSFDEISNVLIRNTCTYSVYVSVYVGVCVCVCGL